MAFKNNKEYKAEKRRWNSSALRQRSPAGYQRFLQKEDAWKAAKRNSKNNNNNNKSNNNSSSAPANRSSGKYDDIRAAQGEDRNAGQEMANQLKNLEAQVGGISPEVQAQLDALTLANSSLNQQLSDQRGGWESQLSSLNQQLRDQQTGFQSQLQQTAADYQSRLDAQTQESAAAMQRIETMMLQQQQQAAQAQQLLQSQLQSTQAALQTQQRMSANLANAYVPQAEASAQSVAYGDARTQGRRQADNSLSDLSIVNGVGTGSTSLTGLQLAG